MGSRSGSQQQYMGTDMTLMSSTVNQNLQGLSCCLSPNPWMQPNFEFVAGIVNQKKWYNILMREAWGDGLEIFNTQNGSRDVFRHCKKQDFETHTLVIEDIN